MVAVAPLRQKQPQREADVVLLIQAGWVGITLIVVACIPVWRADSLKQSAQPKIQPKVVEASPTVKQSKPLLVQAKTAIARSIFAGGSDSLVAHAVGHAEGTRTPDGRRTRAYYGHVDPGNGVWNLGSFSFQHCREARYSCSTPEQADEHQLQRLQVQNAQLQQRTQTLGLQLTLEEELNGIDLANQAPLAALSDGGYADRLLQAKQKGLSAQAAILEARVWSYWNPQTNGWDAPGLGNTEETIRHDQNRRLLAIARAISAHQQAGQSANRYSNLLKLQPDAENPYSFVTERSNYLWWDAGFWDGVKQQRQVPPGYEPAYDAGFEQGSNF